MGSSPEETTSESTERSQGGDVVVSIPLRKRIVDVPLLLRGELQDGADNWSESLSLGVLCRGHEAIHAILQVLRVCSCVGSVPLELLRPVQVGKEFLHTPLQCFLQLGKN
jgi:hypothetical protein